MQEAEAGSREGRVPGNTPPATVDSGTISRTPLVVDVGSTGSTTPKKRRRKASERQVTANSNEVSRTSASVGTSAENDRKISPKVQKESQSQSTRRRKTLLEAAAEGIANTFSLIFGITSSLLSTLLNPLWSAIVTVLSFTILLLFVYYQARSFLFGLAPILPSGGLALAWTLPRAIYCSSIGYGCQRQSQPTVADLARTVSKQATQAHDIFDSISAMGDPANLGLHHTEIWELAVAVVASSQLPQKDLLGPSLKDLGDATRDVKDRLISINAFGINSFSWTLREFKRIERTIHTMHKQQESRKPKYKAKDITKMLDDLFERLNGNMEKLLDLIEKAIPEASVASQLGGTISEALRLEHHMLREHKENTPLWRHLLDKQSWKGKQLSRDLSLAEESISNVKIARVNLEKAREFLLQYRDNTAYFKASLTGYHLSDHSLDPTEEVEHLADIMQDFDKAVSLAKGGGYSQSKARDAQIDASSSHSYNHN